MEKIKSVLGNLIGIDEAKWSAIILILIGSTIFGGFMYYTTGEISDNWTNIIITAIWAIAGVNGVNAVSKIFDAKG